MRLALVLLSTLILAESVRAQGTRGYIFAAPGWNNGPSNPPASFGILPAPPTAPNSGANNNYSAGFGLEYRTSRFIGFGGDLAGIMPGSGQIIKNTVGVFSPNGYFHFPVSNPNLDLYATGGYSLLFRDFSVNGVNGGGGMCYWFKERVGLNLEFRVLQVFGANPPTPATRYYQVRIGFSFRPEP